MGLDKKKKQKKVVEEKTLPEFQQIGSSQDGLDSPLGQFACVVLELIGQDSPSLNVQLLSPVHAARVLRVPLVQSLNVQILDVIVSSGHHGIVFTPGQERRN